MGAGLGLFVCLFACPLVAGGQTFGLVRSSGGALPAFCPLSFSACGGLLADMPLFSVLKGFLEGFGVVVWVCVGWVVCVACGAFVRVWS